MNFNEKQALIQLIRRIRDLGVAVVLIEHDMGLIMELAERIVVLNYGKEIAVGTPEQIKHDPVVIEAYLGVEDEPLDATKLQTGTVDLSLLKGDDADKKGEALMSSLTVQAAEVYYGRVHALRELSFDVHEGEIVCLLGNNGAGKSTTMNMLSGSYGRTAAPSRGAISTSRGRSRGISSPPVSSMCPKGGGSSPP